MKEEIVIITSYLDKVSYYGDIYKDMVLVKQAVKEYFSGELSANEAMMCIHVVINTEKPDKECVEWAKKEITK